MEKYFIGTHLDPIAENVIKNNSMPNKDSFSSHEEYLNWYKEYREKNRNKLRLYSRDYNKKWRKENGYYLEEDYKIRYPEKIKAHYEVRKALKKGELKRDHCILCKDKRKKAQAHHEDYSKPLEVIWLCPLCHRKVHDKKIILKNVLGS